MASLDHHHDEPACVPLVLAPIRDLADELRTRPRPLNALDLAAVAAHLGSATQPAPRGPLGVQA